MTPLLNVINVAVLGIYAAGRPPEPRSLLLAIARNPFVLSCLTGILFQVLGIPLPKTILAMLDIIGKGALGLALLAAGAGLRFHELRATGATLALATVLKLVAMPLLVYGFPARPSMSPLFAPPCRPGRVPIFWQSRWEEMLPRASILTLQVIVAALTLPLITILLGI